MRGIVDRYIIGDVIVCVIMESDSSKYMREREREKRRDKCEG